MTARAAGTRTPATRSASPSPQADGSELVQFRPSGLLESDDAAGTLVSEAARGEAGVLRNGLGERFMERDDPARLELSTRNRIALAVYTEIKEGRGTANGGVWLDVSHLPRQTIEHAGVVRDDDGLTAALARLEDIEAAATDLGVHPDWQASRIWRTPSTSGRR